MLCSSSSVRVEALALLDGTDTLLQLFSLFDLALQLYKPCSSVEDLVHGYGIPAVYTLR